MKKLIIILTMAILPSFIGIGQTVVLNKRAVSHGGKVVKAPLVTLLNGLVGYWKLDETS